MPDTQPKDLPVNRPIDHTDDHTDDHTSQQPTVSTHDPAIHDPMADLITPSTIKQAMNQSFLPSVDDQSYHFTQERCPYQLCDGSGYTIVTQNGRTYAKTCPCYEEEVLKRTLLRSNIQEKYLQCKFDLEGTVATVLKKKKKTDVIEPLPKKNKNETPDQFLRRHYDCLPIKKGINAFAQEYTEKVFSFMADQPRQRMINLFLLGEPGKGKTHIACAIARSFALHKKSVYFTTMLKLVADVLNPDAQIRQKMEQTDLVVIDEVGYEYHTDTKWALKQIKDLLRVRYNSHLPVVCTSNLYPNELAEMYDDSLMSIFHGAYLFTLIESPEDFRLQESDPILQEFSSLS